MNTGKLRIAQVVEWSNGGQGFIALIRGDEVIARFSNWGDAKRAYRNARKEKQS